MKLKLPSFAEIRKFVVAVLGIVSTGLTLGLFHGTAAHAAAGVLAAASAVGVYAVPNAAPAAAPVPNPAKPSGS